MNQHLFSYGTLQKESVQLALFGRVVPGWPDTLNGYKVVPIEITDRAFLAKGEQKMQLTIVPSTDENDCISGTALELTEEELLHSDKYEPANYKRIKVVLASGKEAWVYRAVEAG
jgi:hypothetical protein